MLSKFEATLNEKFNGRLQMGPNTIYVNSSTPLTVIDTVLDREVQVIPDYIKRGIYNPDYAPPPEKLVRDHPALSDSPYEYGDSRYRRIHDAVTITCHRHGPFTQKLSDHIHKRVGCPACAGNERVPFEEFVRRSRDVHGELYQYDSSTYTSMSDVVSITCSIHGPWRTLGYNHTFNRSGCPGCNKSHQHDPTDEGILYLIRCPDLGCLKVGITSPSAYEKRMSRHRKNYGQIELLHTQTGTIGQVLMLESLILLKCERYSYESAVEGRTEFLVDSKPNIDTATTLAISDSPVNVVPYSRAQNRKWFDRSIHTAPMPFAHEVLSSPHLFRSTTFTNINARDCQVRSVDAATARTFYNATHIQGSPQSLGQNYGLYLGDTLVMVITTCASRSNTDKNVVEILRMATAVGHRVRGGASKLFNAITNALPNGTRVESYNDDRLFSGRIYATLGMTKERITQPDYYWMLGDTVLRRSATRRAKLPALLGEQFNPALSESMNMHNAGWVRIWGSGHTLYVFTVDR